MEPEICIVHLESARGTRKTILADGKFVTLKSDEDRAKYLIDKNIENNYKFYGNPDPEQKDVDKSTMYRGMGNEAFTNNPSTLKSIFDLYCKGIAYAPSGTKELALAYANRSAVLFKAQFYNDSLVDIERALSIGYPIESQGKLLIRKAKCLYALKGKVDSEVTGALVEARKSVEILAVHDKTRRMVEEIVDDPTKMTSVNQTVRKLPSTNSVPALFEENPKLPGASTSIALGYCEQYGRHIVATEDIEPGEVLVVQKPYVTMMSKRNIYDICGHCNEQTWTGIPCDNCVHFMYCSDDCKQKAWREYHDMECVVFSNAVAAKMNTLLLMAVRMTIMAFKEAGSFEALHKRLKELDSINDRKSNIDFIFKPDSYETMYMLDDASEKYSPGEAFYWAYNSVAVTFTLATKTNFFGKKIPPRIEIMKDTEWFAFIAGLTARNMKITRTHTCFMSYECEGIDAPEICALIPLYCFVNHNCYSQAQFNCFQGVTALITPTPVKKGEQVCVCYHELYPHASRESRQEYLQKMYRFTCNCLACVENWDASSITSYRNQGLSSAIRRELKLNFFMYERLSQQECGDNIMKRVGAVIQSFYRHTSPPCAEVFIMSTYMVKLYRDLRNQYISID